MAAAVIRRPEDRRKGRPEAQPEGQSEGLPGGWTSGRPQGQLNGLSEAGHATRLAALTLLARRDFATGELRERLADKGHPLPEIEAVVAQLLAEGGLDDGRYAASYVSYHADRGQGPRRIAQDLAQRGVAAALIDAALEAGPDWKALARQTRARRFGREVPEEWSAKARQARFLQYRGFSSDHIRWALGPEFESEDIT